MSSLDGDSPFRIQREFDAIRPGSRDEPSIGGVPWNGSIYIDHPKGLSPVRLLYWRLMFDFVWVMRNLVTIMSKESNRPVKFHPNRPQQWALWNAIEQTAVGEPHRGWYLKGRQFGYSTLWMTVLFICSALRGQNSLLLAHLEKPGKSIFRKAETSLKSMPTYEHVEHDESGEVVSSQVIGLVSPPTSTESQSLMAWVGSHFNAVMRRDSAENRDAGVGETFQNIQITEPPLYPDAQHTLGHLFPTLAHAPNTHVMGEFTARTEGDYTHRQWLRAVSGQSVFRAVFAAWYWHTPYKRARRERDAPFSAEELDYREVVRRKGHEFPLTESGHLVPRLRVVYEKRGRVDVHDLAVGFDLSDEQLLFRRDMLEYFAGDYQLWRSEFPYCPEEAFTVAGRKLIPPNVMDLMDECALEPLDQPKGRGEYRSYATPGGKASPTWVARSDGRVHRFEMPQAAATYVVTCDPSSGAGVDPTGVQVLRVSYQSIREVASFEGMERPYEVARLLARIGRHYRSMATIDSQTKKLVGGRPAHIAIERNGFGEHIIHELVYSLKYKNVLRYTDRTRDDYKHGHDYGFPTTVTTKMPMLNHLAQLCYDKMFIAQCRRTLASLRGMQYLDALDRTAGAPKGQHDDLAMSAGIGVWFAAQLGVFKFEPKEKQPEWLRDRLRASSRLLFPRAG